MYFNQFFGSFFVIIACNSFFIFGSHGVMSKTPQKLAKIHQNLVEFSLELRELVAEAAHAFRPFFTRFRGMFLLVLAIKASTGS